MVNSHPEITDVIVFHMKKLKNMHDLLNLLSPSVVIYTSSCHIQS